MNTPRTGRSGGPPNYFECFPEEKLLQGVTFAYVRAARSAYSVTTRLSRNLKVPYMIMATAMAYFHRFFFSSHQKLQASASNESKNNNTSSSSNNVDSSSASAASPTPSTTTTTLQQQKPAEVEIIGPVKTFDVFHPVIVAVAAFFLALKTECVHRPLSQIIQCAFEITPNHQHYPIRREQIVRTELMLMHSLDFNLMEELPWKHAVDLLPPPDPKTNVDHKATQLFKKIFGYVIHFPFQGRISAVALAQCAVWFVWDSLEMLHKNETTKTLLDQLTSVTKDMLSGFAAHIMDYIVYYDRAELREIPKITARATSLKSKVRYVYGGLGGSSNNLAGLSSPAVGVGTPTSNQMSVGASSSTVMLGGGGGGGGRGGGAGGPSSQQHHLPQAQQHSCSSSVFQSQQPQGTSPTPVVVGQQQTSSSNDNNSKNNNNNIVTATTVRSVPASPGSRIRQREEGENI